MRTKTVIVLAVLLSSCNRGGGNLTDGNAPATDGSINVVVRVPTIGGTNSAAPAAPDLAGARALVEQIYQPYTRGETPRTGNLYTSELAIAIARQSDTDTGLGYDPFCRCQDFDNFRYTIQSVEPRPDGATARIAFTNLGESHNVTLLLDHRVDRWLVADIQEGNDSLLAGGRAQR